MSSKESIRKSNWPIWLLLFGYIFILGSWIFFGALLGWIYNGFFSVIIDYTDLATTLFTLVTTIPLAIIVCLLFSISLLLLNFRQGAIWIAVIPYLLCVLSIAGLTLSFTADNTQPSANKSNIQNNAAQRKELRFSFDHILVSLIDRFSHNSEEDTQNKVEEKNDKNANQSPASKKSNSESDIDNRKAMDSRDFSLRSESILSHNLNELTVWYGGEIDIATTKLESNESPSAQDVEIFNKRIESLIAEFEKRRKAIISNHSTSIIDKE